MTNPTTAAHVGFIGIGNQGAPMAMRIHDAGLPLVVWARRPEALRDFDEAGATCAESILDLARACTMVAVCVTNDDDVRAVTLGDLGLLAAMAPGSTVALHSTVHPDTVAQVADVARESDISVLDAPVSGGAVAAAEGSLAILAGGDDAVLERWRPVLSTFAGSIEHLGPLGSGQLAKLVNNALSATTLAASLRSLGAASALGLDPEAIFRVLAASSGDSFMLRHAPAMAQHGAQLAAERYRKDIDLFATVVAPDDRAGQALATSAQEAVSFLETVAGSLHDDGD